MSKFVIVAFLVILAVCHARVPDFNIDPLPNNGTNWAVLVAGSSGWENYRHQSDVCHAYQILHKNGIPDSNIIVMMYDDIADSVHNREKGKIFNSMNGVDVYAGVPKDYTKDAVTPANFIKILNGEVPSGGSGKTLKSGPNDRVFVYFADHGASGLIAFPTLLGIINRFLHAEVLMTALKDMASQQRFHQLVFYLEACESGSMFNQLLPNNINIYATTAASPFESSYACTFDDHLGVYLDDCYSINWMNDTDYANVHTETLQTQFENIYPLTNLSSVCQYGDLSIASQPLSNYMSQNSFAHHDRVQNKHAAVHPHTAPSPLGAVSSRDVKLATLRRLSELVPDELKEVMHSAVVKELKSRAHADAAIRMAVMQALRTDAAAADRYVSNTLLLAQHSTADQCHSSRVPDFACLRPALHAFERSCGPVSDYALQHVRVLDNLCHEAESRDTVIAAAAHACAAL